jgi:hypothetical protein
MAAGDPSGDLFGVARDHLVPRERRQLRLQALQFRYRKRPGEHVHALADQIVHAARAQRLGVVDHLERHLLVTGAEGEQLRRFGRDAQPGCSQVTLSLRKGGQHRRELRQRDEAHLVPGLGREARHEFVLEPGMAAFTVLVEGRAALMGEHDQFAAVDQGRQRIGWRRRIAATGQGGQGQHRQHPRGPAGTRRRHQRPQRRHDLA